VVYSIKCFTEINKYANSNTNSPLSKDSRILFVKLEIASDVPLLVVN